MTQNRSLSLLALAKNFSVQRIAVAGFIFLSSIALAKILPATDFGAVAFFLYLVKQLMIFQLGSGAGYIYRVYNDGQGRHPREDFAFFYALQFLIFMALVMAASLRLGAVYFWAALAFSFLLPFHVAEPMARVERKFYVSLMPDSVLYAAALLVTAGTFFYSDAPAGKTVIPWIVFLLPFFWIAAAKIWGALSAEAKIFSWPPERGHLLSFAKNIRIGFPLYIGTQVYVLFLFTDRYFLEQFHAADALGSYMLAGQLALGACLVITAQNFVAGIDIGESKTRNLCLHDAFRRQLRSALLIALPSYGALAAGTYVLQEFFLKDYPQLLAATLILGLGYMAFFVAGSVTSIVFFEGRQKILTWTLVAALLAAWLHNLGVLAAGAHWLWLPAFSSLWLFSYAVFAILHSARAAIRAGASKKLS